MEAISPWHITKQPLGSPFTLLFCVELEVRLGGNKTRLLLAGGSRPKFLRVKFEAGLAQNLPGPCGLTGSAHSGRRLAGQPARSLPLDSSEGLEYRVRS